MIVQAYQPLRQDHLVEKPSSQDFILDAYYARRYYWLKHPSAAKLSTRCYAKRYLAGVLCALRHV
jgi:hypothetical protein